MCWVTLNSGPRGCGSLLQGYFMGCRVKPRPRGRLADRWRVVFGIRKRVPKPHGRGSQGGRSIQPLVWFVAQTLISSTQIFVGFSGGRAKTSELLATRAIKGVFRVYLDTTGVMATNSTSSRNRIYICFLRGETRYLGVVGHPM